MPAAGGWGWVRRSLNARGGRLGMGAEVLECPWREVFPSPLAGEGRERGKSVGRGILAASGAPLAWWRAVRPVEGREGRKRKSPSPCPSPALGGGNRVREGCAWVVERVGDGSRTTEGRPVAGGAPLFPLPWRERGRVRGKSVGRGILEGSGGPLACWRAVRPVAGREAASGSPPHPCPPPALGGGNPPPSGKRMYAAPPPALWGMGTIFRRAGG